MSSPLLHLAVPLHYLLVPSKVRHATPLQRCQLIFAEAEGGIDRLNGSVRRGSSGTKGGVSDHGAALPKPQRL